MILLNARLREPIMDVASDSLERSVEGIHRLRVAGRHLRTTLRVYRPILDPEASRALGGELKWLHQRLGPVRDWDVLAVSSLAPLSRQFPESPGLSALIDKVDSFRTTARRAALRSLRSVRFARLLETLEALCEGREGCSLLDPDAVARAEGAIRPFARTILARRLTSVRRKARRAGLVGSKVRWPQEGGPDPEQERALHRLRIAMKTLRYAADGLSPLFPARRVKANRRSMQGVQTALGILQDSAMVLERLSASPLGGEGKQGEALALLRGYAARCRLDSLDQLPAAWRRFHKTAPFWTA